MDVVSNSVEMKFDLCNRTSVRHKYRDLSALSKLFLEDNFETKHRNASFTKGLNYSLTKDHIRTRELVMLIPKTIPSIARCSNCRAALLNLVVPYAGLSLQQTTRVPHTRLGSRGNNMKQCFSTSPVWTSDLLQQLPQKELPQSEETSLKAEQNDELNEVPEPTTSAKPWFLQVEAPQRTNPLLQRQQIPELPPDAPPLLKPMLEHISVDLGLDDLTIFDLRDIDPPPALGANLIMVLSTARSEKHLHVSADKFCTWLKTEHKLHPYPDGLMGKGEIKLKLKRKARRAKLLSSVGSSEISDKDDGLRTGWICVNVGTIEDGRDHVKYFTEQYEYVGFGREAEGAKVVVQMLTQEKREELNLEELWGKMIRRQNRKEKRISQAEDGLSADHRADLDLINELRSRIEQESALNELRKPRL